MTESNFNNGGDFKNYKIEYLKLNKEGTRRICSDGPIFSTPGGAIKYLEKAGYKISGYSTLTRQSDMAIADIVGNENR